MARPEHTYSPAVQGPHPLLVLAAQWHQASSAGQERSRGCVLHVTTHRTCNGEVFAYCSQRRD